MDNLVTIEVEPKPDPYQSYTCALGEIAEAMSMIHRAGTLMEPFSADNDVHALICLAHSAAFLAHQQIVKALSPNG